MLMQPITLITGVPGAGKTLRGIYEAMELQKSGREVYAVGIDGLDPDLIESLPEDWKMEDWSNLPDGSVIVVDEAHKFFPVRTKDKVPEWMSKLTEIRHSGKNLILITQDPRNIDAFVRRLVGEHLHLTRKAGFSGALVRTFAGVAENPDDYHAKKQASAVPWLYPKSLFKVYKSATMHVIKPKLPFKLWLIIGFFLCLLILIPIGIFKFKGLVFDGGKGDSQDGTTSQTSAFGLSTSDDDETMTAEEFVEKHTPVIPVAPWSAPIYHDLTPTAVPKIYCIESGRREDKNLNCQCRTEQYTKIENIPFLICQKIVRDGIYNPFLVPSQEVAKSQNERVRSLAPTSAPATSLITSPVFNHDTITPKRDSVH